MRFSRFNALQQLSGTMVQYWKIKRLHMDKVCCLIVAVCWILTRLHQIVWMAVGSFYEVYDVDAGVCQRELNLTYKNEEKAKHRNVGVPKSRLDEVGMHPNSDSGRLPQGSQM